MGIDIYHLASILIFIYVEGDTVIMVFNNCLDIALVKNRNFVDITVANSLA